MSDLKRSILNAIYRRLPKTKVLEIGPTGDLKDVQEIDDMVTRALERNKKVGAGRGIFKAAVEDSLDESNPETYGRLLLGSDDVPIGAVSFDPYTRPAAQADKSMMKFEEATGDWPGEIKYLASFHPGVGSALFNLARAEMADRVPNSSTVLYSLADARPFYRKMGMERLEDYLNKLSANDLMLDPDFFHGIGASISDVMPSYKKPEYETGGTVEEKPKPKPEYRRPPMVAGIRG